MNTRRNFVTTISGKAIQLFLTAIGAVGIPAIILPFAYDTSPLAVAWSHDMFLKDMWRFSWPFFLPVLITLAIVRWIILKKYSRAEVIAGYMVSAAILGITFSGYLGRFEWTDDINSQIAFISPFVILSFGIFIVLRNWKKLIPKPGGAIVVMQVAYLANCFLCLSGFIGSWQIAAYLSLATAIAYLIQIFLPIGEIQTPL